MNRVLYVVIIASLMAYGVPDLGLNYYRDNAIVYKTQHDKNARGLKLTNVATTDMQMRRRDVTAPDVKHSRELADTKAENETLRADVAAGRKCLCTNATCPDPVHETTDTAHVDNATGPQLTDTAKRDCFILRERLMTMQKQLEGTQEYIRTRCTRLAFYYPENI